MTMTLIDPMAGPDEEDPDLHPDESADPEFDEDDDGDGALNGEEE